MAMQEDGIKARSELELQLIDRAWKDDAFRRQLLQNPKDAISQVFDLKLPPGMSIQVLEDTPEMVHLVIPNNPAARPSGELSDAQLEQVAGGMWANSNYTTGTGAPDHCTTGCC